MIFYDHIDEMTLFNDAMEASGMAWWLLEYPSGLMFFSENKLKMLGYDTKDADKFVHLTTFNDLLHPDDRAKAMKTAEDYLAGKTKEYQLDYRIKSKNGRYKHFFDRGKIVGKNKDGQLCVAGFAMDLSKTNLVPTA